MSAHLSAPDLVPLLETFYAAYRCSEPEADANLDRSISLGREGRAYRLVGPSGDWEAETPGEAALYYESELTGALLEDTAAYVHLHGAAVYDDRRCLLLVGPSGAGKSTLTLGLCRGGWQALADDALLLDPETGEVQPFERSIRVHRASLETLGIEPERVEGGRMCEPYLWVSPATGGPGVREARRPNVCVFLEGADRTVLERLSAAETLTCLLVARLGGEAARDFECLARLAEDVPGYRLVYRDLKEALTELERL